jgi:hypothetical protein
MTTRVDVLVFDDQKDQQPRILKWFALSPNQCEFSQTFVKASPNPRHPYEQSDIGWRWIESEILRIDPKVVVFDFLLAKQFGDVPYDGLEYGNRCKTHWAELGVILITTGGDATQGQRIASQEQLDELRRANAWPIDAAWIKPWGPAEASVPDTKVQVETQTLIRQSRRPSEHKRASS